MLICAYCGNDNDERAAHPACRAESDRREAAGLCIFCGTKLADSDIAKGWRGHEACYGPYKFSGYPGS